MYVKKNLFGILLHEFVKMENIQQVLWMIQIMCDEIIDADTEGKWKDGAKPINKETKTIPKNKIFDTKKLYILLAFF